LAFGVWRLAFGVWRLAFGVWRLAFGVWRSAFGVRRSAFGRSAFGVRRSAFGRVWEIEQSQLIAGAPVARKALGDCPRPNAKRQTPNADTPLPQSLIAAASIR